MCSERLRAVRKEVIVRTVVLNWGHFSSPEDIGQRLETFRVSHWGRGAAGLGCVEARMPLASSCAQDGLQQRMVPPWMAAVTRAPDSKAGGPLFQDPCFVLDLFLFLTTCLLHDPGNET